MSTTASEIATELNTLRGRIEILTAEINSERDGLPALRVLAGAGTDEETALKERRQVLKDANAALNEASSLYNQARTALLNDKDKEEARRLLNEAKARLVAAFHLFRGSAPASSTPAPTPVPTPPAAPDNGNGGDDSPKPVKGKDEKDPATPTPPAAPEPDADKAPAWATALQDSVRGALEQNAETIRVHVEGCNTTLEEFREALAELAKGTLKPEIADILNTFGAQELSDFIAGNGGGSNINVDEINRRLDELTGRINTDDLQFLRDLRVIMGQEGLTLPHLIASVKGGRILYKVASEADKRRWSRSGNQPGSHS